MSYVGTHQAMGSVKLTVLEYFADMNYVHVPCKQIIDLNLDHTRLFVKHLVACSEILKNRKHRLYYMVPPFGTIMSLDDIVSVEVFFEWFYRNVNDVYAVIENSTTFDFKKVVKLHVNQMPTVDLERIKDFKRSVAKPFSHRPMQESMEVDRGSITADNSSTSNKITALSKAPATPVKPLN